jgi:hypothetical protein
VRRHQLLRLAAAVVGLVMLAGGVVALLLPLVGTPDDSGFRPVCGSAVRPVLPAPDAAEGAYREDCSSLEDARRQDAIPWLVLGAILVGGAVAVPARTTADLSV